MNTAEKRRALVPGRTYTPESLRRLADAWFAEPSDLYRETNTDALTVAAYSDFAVGATFWIADGLSCNLATPQMALERLYESRYLHPTCVDDGVVLQILWHANCPDWILEQESKRRGTACAGAAREALRFRRSIRRRLAAARAAALSSRQRDKEER